ncbi:WD40/YVTN/BNR-like repeat-containing protein [Emticicia sp. SJ17W-69]|uniref:WD40/YVTN/BNR-like repeat-containing protein n=1 Tax=Emticicia sp. SJ17W-69 TaxID=3421657 RepID=UPI003EC048CC
MNKIIINTNEKAFWETWCLLICSFFLADANAQQLGADFSISNFPENATSVTLNKGTSYTLNNLSTNLCEITNYTWTITPYRGGSTTGYTISSNTAINPTISFSVSGIYTVKLDVLTYPNSPAYICGNASATTIKTAFINILSTPNANACTETSIPIISGSGFTCSMLTASANGATGFQWYKDFNAILGATSATYTPTDAATYQVATTLEEGYWMPTLASPSNQQLIDLFFINSTTGWVLGSDGQIFKTTLGGDNWTQQTSGITTTLNSIYFTNPNNGVAVGANGVIVRTMNGGTTWQTVSSGVSNNLTDVFFLNAATGWAVGSQYLVLKTIDGGATWNTVSIDNGASTNDTYTDVQFTDINTGYLTGSSSANNTSFVRKSVDGGINWTTSTSTSAGVYRKLSFIDNNTGWTGGRNANPSVTLPDVSKTVNGGTNWLSYSAIQTTAYANRGITSLQFIDNNRGWMLSSNIIGSDIITTKNGGNTFFKGSTYFTQPTQYIGIRIFMLPGGSSGWIIGRDYGSNNNILRYSNTICTSNAVAVSGSNLTLSGNATTSTQRAGTIISTQRVAAGATSIYSATQSVTLSPTFQANNGSVFSAKIEGCN